MAVRGVAPRQYQSQRSTISHFIGFNQWLFRTPHGREHWERTARHNLRAELDLLTL